MDVRPCIGRSLGRNPDRRSGVTEEECPKIFSTGES